MGKTIFKIRQSLLVLNSFPQSEVADVREAVNGNSGDEERHAQSDAPDGLQADVHPGYIGGASDGLPCKEIFEELPSFF